LAIQLHNPNEVIGIELARLEPSAGDKGSDPLEGG
jgi:hypothetical protein